MWLTHFWHSWSQFFIFAWDVTAGGILRTGVLICLVEFVESIPEYTCVLAQALSLSGVMNASEIVSVFFGDFYQHALESIVGNIVPALYMLSDL